MLYFARSALHAAPYFCSVRDSSRPYTKIDVNSGWYKFWPIIIFAPVITGIHVHVLTDKNDALSTIKLRTMAENANLIPVATSSAPAPRNKSERVTLSAVEANTKHVLLSALIFFLFTNIITGGVIILLLRHVNGKYSMRICERDYYWGVKYCKKYYLLKLL